jgi:multisubunit Na+/H+ antiporter MnhC subunit
LKKILILLSILILASLFAGCTNVTMKYSIDDNNLMRVSYSMILDKTKEEFKDFDYYYLIKDITNQWEQQDMIVTVDDNEEQLSISGTFEKEHNSRKDAYESLDAILKSEYSPFTTAGFEYAPSYFEDEYNFDASISLKDLIRRTDEAVIPSDMQEIITGYANESEFSLIISLPGEAESTNSDNQEYSDGITTNTWNLKYGDEKTIELKSVIVNEENIEYHKSLTDSTNQALLITIICAGAAVLVLIIFLIIFFVKKSRSATKNQSNKVEIPL